MPRRTRSPKPQTRQQKVDALILDFLHEELPLSRTTVLNIYSARGDREFAKGRLAVLEEEGRVVSAGGDRLVRRRTPPRG